nr:MAG TPA: hypothetical protein [Caudoviricetes sp.]
MELILLRIASSASCAAYKTATDYQKATGKEVLKEWNTQGDYCKFCILCSL